MNTAMKMTKQDLAIVSRAFQRNWLNGYALNAMRASGPSDFAVMREAVRSLARVVSRPNGVLIDVR